MSGEVDTGGAAGLNDGHVRRKGIGIELGGQLIEDEGDLMGTLGDAMKAIATVLITDS